MAASPSEENDGEKSAGFPVARLALGIGLVLLLLGLGRVAGAYVPAFADWVAGLGPLGPAAFVLAYALAVVAVVPGSLLTLAAGAIFGLVKGTIYVFIAAVMGSAAAFLIARHMARASIERRIDGDERFAAIDRAIGREGRKIVLLLRLSPVFPFNLLNYVLGLTQVKLVDYLVAGVGMLPGTLLFVYTGKLAGDVAAAVGGAEIERGLADWGILGIGLIATLVVTVYVTRLARRELDTSTRDRDEDASSPT